MLLNVLLIKSKIGQKHSLFEKDRQHGNVALVLGADKFHSCLLLSGNVESHRPVKTRHCTLSQHFILWVRKVLKVICISKVRRLLRSLWFDLTMEISIQFLTDFKSPRDPKKRMTQKSENLNCLPKRLDFL